MARFPSSLFVAVTATAIACFASGCSGEGAAPNVKDLTVSSTSAAALSVGKVGVLEGQVFVEDADGDLDELYAEVTIPDGRSQTLAPTKLQGAGSAKSGPVKVMLGIQPPAAGEYTLNVWIRDEKDNDSPKISTKFTVK